METAHHNEGDERGVLYNFPKIFQAKLNKNEWNIFKYHCIDEVEQISLANHLYYKIT